MEIKDFLEDEAFVKWVLNGDQEQEVYWADWIKNNPQNLDAFNAAKEFIEKMKLAQLSVLPESYGGELWERIKTTIKGQEEKKLPVARKAFNRWWAAAAAVVLMAVGSVYYLYNRFTVQHELADNTGIWLHKTDAVNIERKNKGIAVQTVYLADGSKVMLEPGSSIRNLALFNKEKREVYLSGNAFFEVAKDASRPFYVYANGVVTKVLGTSFRVRAIPGESGVMVAVRTGRVAVNRQQPSGDEENEGIVLLPNQQAVFNVGQHKLVKIEVADTALISRPPVVIENFVFQDEQVSTIFDKLEKVYSVEIVYNKEAFNKCLITTSLQNESLYDKLKILCDAIGATFTIADNRINIEGRGCN